MIEVLELKEIRERLHDKTLTIVANMTGVKVGVIHRIKNGYLTNPKLNDVIRLSNYLK